MVQYVATNKDNEGTLSVFGNGWQKPVASTHPQYSTLLTYLATTPESEHDEDYIQGLIDPAVGIGRILQQHFGERVTYDLHYLYLDGFVVSGGLASFIKERMMSREQDWVRYVRFLVNLEKNPSKRAKDAVWAWVEKHGVSVTEDGRIAGFKGLVNGTDAVTGEPDVPVSYHSGPNNFIDGVLYGEVNVPYQVPHRVGTVISKRRGDVDDNSKVACSTGLHVGAYSYAKTFGENRDEAARYSTMGRMATTLPNSTFAIVVFSPEDVVSVPEDNTADWKIRVAAYEVSEFLDRVEDVLQGKPTYDVKTPAPFLPRSEPFEGEPTVEAVEEPEVNLSQAVPFEDSNGDNMLSEGGPLYDEDDEDDYDEDVDTEDEVLEAEIEIALQEEPVEEEEPALVTPTEGTGLFGRLALRDWAKVNPNLARDLNDHSIGHQAVARKYAGITTESSVRRYRKG